MKTAERDHNGGPVSVAVDLSLVTDSKVRNEVRREMEALGHPASSYRGFWSALQSTRYGELPAKLIVMADLSRLAAAYERSGVRAWTDCFRTASPLLIAFVHRREDERCTHVIDDLLRASACRLWVYTIGKSVRRDLHACLSKVVDHLDPESVIDVRYAEADRTVWIEFADGLRRAIPWAALNLTNVRPALRPQTIRVANRPYTLQIGDAKGGVFDVDTAALRALVDDKVSRAHVAVAEAAVTHLGERLRARRERTGVTQTDLAELSGLTQEMISNLERGQHEPRVATLQKYADGLGLSVVELLKTA
jgi:DNA-binding XRE family transcriptional regulator